MDEIAASQPLFYLNLSHPRADSDPYRGSWPRTQMLPHDNGV
jgi:hypothetical protein